MRPTLDSHTELVVLTQEGMTLGDVEAVLRDNEFNGFPVVLGRGNMILVGFVSRYQSAEMCSLNTLVFQARSATGHPFSQKDPAVHRDDLSDLLHQSANSPRTTDFLFLDARHSQCRHRCSTQTQENS